MRGYANFNFPAFNRAAKTLRGKDHVVFNPAEHDNQKHGTDISAGNLTGDEDQAAREHGGMASGFHAPGSLGWP